VAGSAATLVDLAFFFVLKTIPRFFFDRKHGKEKDLTKIAVHGFLYLFMAEAVKSDSSTSVKAGLCCFWDYHGQ
jgi:hypothetical protein